MTERTDRDVAKAIYDAVSVLNKALSEATDLNVEISLDKLDHWSGGRRSEIISLNVDVSKSFRFVPVNGGPASPT